MNLKFGVQAAGWQWSCLMSGGRRGGGRGGLEKDGEVPCSALSVCEDAYWTSPWKYQGGGWSNESGAPAGLKIYIWKSSAISQGELTKGRWRKGPAWAPQPLTEDRELWNKQRGLGRRGQ